MLKGKTRDKMDETTDNFTEINERKTLNMYTYIHIN